MKDILETEIKQGDFVFYGQTSRWPEFMVCKIVKEMPKTVKAVRVKGNRKGSPYQRMEDFTIRDGSHCIVISSENVEKILELDIDNQ